VYQTNAVGTAYEPVTDDYGAFYFYAENGRYDYTVTVANVLRETVTDILLYDPTGTSGTWTPTDESGGTALLTTAGGEYIKQGEMVFISGRVKFASNSDATAAVFGGLPFPGRAGSDAYNIGCSYQGNTFGMTLSGTNIGGLIFQINAGSSEMIPRWADVPGLICSNGSLDLVVIYFSGWYRTDS
jgi:hypothetical protein